MFDTVAGEQSNGDDAAAVAELKAELAEAEAAEAEARAEAERARERAADEVVTPVSTPGRRWIAQTVGLALAALLIGVMLTLTGLMLWQHAQVSAQRAQERRCVDAARDGVVALLSIDYNHARADVQRVLDSTTGQFHDDFSRSAEDFIKTAEESKAVTVGKVNAAALDTIDGARARVLISATSVVTNAKGAKEDARPFRMNVAATRDGDTCKMSDVEFVP